MTDSTFRPAPYSVVATARAAARDLARARRAYARACARLDWLNSVYLAEDSLPRGSAAARAAAARRCAKAWDAVLWARKEDLAAKALLR